MERAEMEHKLTLLRREQLLVGGVTEVVSFEDTTVVLQTCMGTLVIQGQGLQLRSLALEGGQVEVRGTVHAMTYEESRREDGWFRRLLG